MELTNGYLTYQGRKYTDLENSEKIKFRLEIKKIKSNESKRKIIS